MGYVVCCVSNKKRREKNKTSFNVVRLDMLLTSRHLIEFRPGIVILSSDPPARSFTFFFFTCRSSYVMERSYSPQTRWCYFRPINIRKCPNDFFWRRSRVVDDDVDDCGGGGNDALIFTSHSSPGCASMDSSQNGWSRALYEREVVGYAPTMICQ